MLSRSIIQDSWSPKKLACSQPLQYFQMDAKRTTPKSMCKGTARWPVVYCFQNMFSIVRVIFRLWQAFEIQEILKTFYLWIRKYMYMMAGSLFAINTEGILYCNALPAFSLRDASCNVIDIEITCRTFRSVIVALFPICTFARGKGSLETMIYLRVSDWRHGFRSTLKLS